MRSMDPEQGGSAAGIRPVSEIQGLGAVSPQSDPAASVPTSGTTTATAEEPSVPTTEPETTEDSPSAPPQRPDPKICGVCHIQSGKYKCPRPGCAMPYCSVACNKSHKENHPPDPILPTPEPAPTQTEQSKEHDPYSVLVDHAHVFQNLFKKYPSLPSALDSIQASTLPPPLSQQFASIPGRRPPQPWTKDVGLRKGAAALRKARTDPSDTGDGVREFCDLVLYLLSTNRERDKAVNLVREEVRKEEKTVIERLLEEETGDGSR